MPGGAALIAVAAAGMLAGCGGSADAGSESSSEELALSKPPGTPAASECGADVLRTSAKPDELVPEPGNYIYDLEGVRRATGREGGRARLPSDVRVKVTSARRVGTLRCYTLYRPYSPQFIDSATFVVRGSDVHLSRLETLVAGRALAVEPNPPVKFIDGDDVEWSGSFSGPTSGRYAGTVLGRRSMRIGGRSERAVGVELRIATTGELRGTTVTRAWFGLDSNLILTEQTRSKRWAGGPRIHVDFELGLRDAGGA